METLNNILAKQIISYFNRGRSTISLGTETYWTRIESTAEFTGQGKKRRKVKGSDRDFYEIRVKRPGGNWPVIHKEERIKQPSQKRMKAK